MGAGFGMDFTRVYGSIGFRGSGFHCVEFRVVGTYMDCKRGRLLVEPSPLPLNPKAFNIRGSSDIRDPVLT